MGNENEYRVLICGSRNWTSHTPIYNLLDRLGSQHGFENLVVIEGEARGADTIARISAEKRGVRVIPCPAEWDKYGKAAGPIRNQSMLTHLPDAVWAFTDNIETSKGTADMVRRAKKAGIPIFVWPDGR